MEIKSDRRFDPNVAAQLLLDIAHEQRLDQLLLRLVERAVQRPDVACAQVWLIDKGDRCSNCPFKAECVDHARCLHLVAGKGTTLGSARAPHFDDCTRRIPVGMGLLGKVAIHGEQTYLKDLNNDPEATVGFDWLREECIRGCGINPIVFKGEVLGVIVGFTRADLPEEARPWGRIFADHVGAAIANARAFEEIQRLKAQLQLQNDYLQEEVVAAKAFGDLVGQSAVLRHVISQIDLVAPTEASVLVLGETGTGKELVAREIHRRSRRADKPLVRVNCASVPRDLFESEFFGHVKGAFTGAVKDRAGRFETAEGGTLLLDEIAEIPLDMQSKLLRVLQDKRYERVGDDRTRHADVRIVGATNRDLRKAVVAGRFREDLYYRLNVFPIQVAPLRERTDDIALLARHFVDVSVRELKCPKPRLTRAAITELENYSWPGNVRELRNVIERAVILARGGPLRFDLPATESWPTAPAAVRNDLSGCAFFTELEIRGRERENLLIVLNKTGWKIKGPHGAAELLGLKPTTLLSRMKQMHLTRPARVQGQIPASRQHDGAE